MVLFSERVSDVTHEWKPVEWSTHVSNPVVLAAMQTFHGGNTAEIRIDSLKRDGFRVKIEEERSQDPEVRHTEEEVGYVVFTPGEIKDSDNNTIGEVGIREYDQPDAEVWRRIEPGIKIDNAVAFVQILSFNGGQPVHPRITDVGPETAERRSAFFLKMEEWEGHDSRHVREKIGYVVLKPGRHRIKDTLEIEVGKVPAVNHAWTPVDLSLETDALTVVITQSQTFNGPDAIVTRLKPDDHQFDVRLQEAEARGAHTNEVVGYMAAFPRII